MASSNRDDMALDPGGRAAPPRLYARIRKSLAIVRFIQVERKRFRRLLLTGLAMAGGAVGAGALMSVIVMRDMPGGMGYFDYLKSQILLSLPAIAGAVGFGVALSLGASVWRAVRASHKSGHDDNTFAV